MRTTITAGGALLIALVVLAFPGTAAASTADPSSWDFGQVPINTTVSKQITISLDTGYQVLAASGTAINNPYSLDFGTCAGFTGPGTCTITESFNPTSTGPSSADLTLSTCSTTTCSTIPVHFTGTGTDGDLALTNVPADITVNATGPGGAVVTYTPPTATDEDTTPPPVTCSPASGTTFPIGTTTVHCSASDADDSNSPVSADFKVTVLGAGVQLRALLTFVRGLPPGTSLPSKVQAAINYFNRGDIRDTCIALTGVINQAQALKGKKLTAAQADAVIAAARNIRSVLQC